MNCWHCDRPAHGSCRFCGRGACKEHVESMPYIVDTYRNEQGQHKALVVADALYCGICQPKEDPVDLTNLT